jgi:hypothetical protein
MGRYGKEPGFDVIGGLGYTHPLTHSLGKPKINIKRSELTA